MVYGFLPLWVAMWLGSDENTSLQTGQRCGGSTLLHWIQRTSTWSDDLTTSLAAVVDTSSVL